MNFIEFLDQDVPGGFLEIYNAIVEDVTHIGPTAEKRSVKIIMQKEVLRGVEWKGKTFDVDRHALFTWWSTLAIL